MRVAVVGASGYTGVELLRLLDRHRYAEITAVTSRQSAGESVVRVFPQLGLSSDLLFTEPELDALASSADVFFLALPHGEAARYAVRLLEAGKIVLDLSADFRLRDAAAHERYYGHAPHGEEWRQKAVYGQPETHAKELRGARLVACAGCYPTSVILALYPALQKGWIDPQSLVINSLSGVSGAGRKAQVEMLFCEANENARAYGVGAHRHIPEIEQELSLAAKSPARVQFTPHLIPLTRGMITTIAAHPVRAMPSQEQVAEVYEAFASAHPFVRWCGDRPPEVRGVTGTNRCDLWARVDGRTGLMQFFSAIDNLTKGASGQAVQCWNMVMGWDEREGLDL